MNDPDVTAADSGEFLDEVEAAPATTEDSLEAIAVLVKRQIELTKQVADTAAALKVFEDDLNAVSTQHLPLAMLNAGQRFLVTPDGYTVEIVTSHHAGITEANKAAAFAWLEEHGFGDIIKNEITVSFGKGEQDLAAKTIDTIREVAPANKLVNKVAVHAGTLKAFVKERIAEGTAIPVDTFGIYTRTVAELTEPGENTIKKNKVVAATGAEF